MQYFNTKRKLLLAAGLALFVSGCNTVRQVDYQGDSGAANPVELTGLDRTVQVYVDPAYRRLAADCVSVMPFGGAADSPVPVVFAQAMARHMRDRFDKVIGPREVAALSRRLVVDLNNPQDRVLFARETRCPLFLEIKPWGTGSTYALVWTRRAAGAETRLTDAMGETVYWRARHAAARTDGGMPFSPVGIVVNMFEAANLQRDQDLDASLADDLARRLVATLPDAGTP